MLNPHGTAGTVTYAPRAGAEARDDDAAAGWLRLLPDHVPIVASAPLAVEPYGAAVLPVGQYVLDQELLGFEAQLRALARLLAVHGRWLNLAPMPEIFASPRSLAAFQDVAPAAAAAVLRPVHLRLGPVRHMRVLKGARNIAVLVDDVVRLPVEAAGYPLGSDINLPLPFTDVLSSVPARRSGPPRAAAAMHADAPAMVPLPDAFAFADLDAAAAASGAPSAAATWHLLNSLRVRSLAEYDAQAWQQPAIAADAAAADWRRALALSRFHATDDAPPPGFVLLPWNLCNAASVVPDLILKVLRWEREAAPRCRVVLYPFNATPATRDAVTQLVARARADHAGTSALRHVFVAKLHGVRDAFSLSSLFPLAWIEADDPESDWTARRLSHLGLRLAAIGKGAFPYSFSVSPDEALRIDCADHFGARTYVTRTLSARQLGLLLARSHRAPVRGGRAAGAHA